MGTNFHTSVSTSKTHTSLKHSCPSLPPYTINFAPTMFAVWYPRAVGLCCCGKDPSGLGEAVGPFLRILAEREVVDVFAGSRGATLPGPDVGGHIHFQKSLLQSLTSNLHTSSRARSPSPPPK